MIQIQIGENTYRSIAAAWREESPPELSQVTVRWRLKQGWSTESAFLVPPVAPVNRRTFKAIRTTLQEVGDE